MLTCERSEVVTPSRQLALTSRKESRTLDHEILSVGSIQTHKTWKEDDSTFSYLNNAPGVLGSLKTTSKKLAATSRKKNPK